MSKSIFFYLAAVDEKAQKKPKPDVSSGFDNLKLEVCPILTGLASTGTESRVVLKVDFLTGDCVSEFNKMYDVTCATVSVCNDIEPRVRGQCTEGDSLGPVAGS